MVDELYIAINNKGISITINSLYHGSHPSHYQTGAGGGGGHGGHGGYSSVSGQQAADAAAYGMAYGVPPSAAAAAAAMTGDAMHAWAHAGLAYSASQVFIPFHNPQFNDECINSVCKGFERLILFWVK